MSQYDSLRNIIVNNSDVRDDWGNDTNISGVERNVRHQIEKMVEEKHSYLNRLMRKVDWDESRLLSHEFRYAQDLRGQIHGMELVASSLGLELWEEHQPNV